MLPLALVRILLHFIHYKINKIMFPFTAVLLLSRIVLTNVSVELQGCDAQSVSPPPRTNKKTAVGQPSITNLIWFAGMRWLAVDAVTLQAFSLQMFSPGSSPDWYATDK